MNIRTAAVSAVLAALVTGGLTVAGTDKKDQPKSKVPAKQSVNKLAKAQDGRGDESMEAAADYKTVPFKTITGNDSSLADFKGKVVMIVNTASECGKTPQYAGLEKIYEKYKDRGFVVVGFPANNFGGQEPGTNEEIQKFCTTKYSVSFPMMAKVSVLGDDKHPLFAYLTEKSDFPGDIRWNFGKFLLDKNGEVVARFDPNVTPEDKEVIAKIESLL